MFSVRQKREIADAVQKILRDTGHPELPEGEITFLITVQGKESWSWAQIQNNGAISAPDVNPHNETQDGVQEIGGILHRALKLIDALMPGIRYIALQNYKEVNDVPWDAGKVLEKYKVPTP